MYGKRRYSKRRTTRRASYRTRTSARRTYKKVGRSFVRKPRFAMTGFSRNIERKFHDKAISSVGTEKKSGELYPVRNNGFTFWSEEWYKTSFTDQVDPVYASNDILKGLGTGTTARTRIGNKVKGCWVKGTMTFTAALTNGGGTQGEQVKNQGGEQWVDDDVMTEEFYLRTTVRFVIVKDTQVNSVDQFIGWSKVFDSTGGAGGLHAQPNIDNMGRFVILNDQKFELSADRPQKTIDFGVSGASIGSVRYNGPSETALTDKGIYLLWAAYTMGAGFTDQGKISFAGPVGQMRFCFTDE